MGRFMLGYPTWNRPTRFKWQRSWPVLDRGNHKSSWFRFGLVAICFGSKPTKSNGGDLDKFGRILMDLNEIWLDLHLEIGGGRSSWLDSVFSCEDPPIGSPYSVFENGNLPSTGRMSFSPGQTVWADKSGRISGWIILVVIHEGINWKFW